MTTNNKGLHVTVCCFVYKVWNVKKNDILFQSAVLSGLCVPKI